MSYNSCLSAVVASSKEFCAELFIRQETCEKILFDTGEISNEGYTWRELATIAKNVESLITCPLNAVEKAASCTFAEVEDYVLNALNVSTLPSCIKSFGEYQCKPLIDAIKSSPNLITKQLTIQSHFSFVPYVPYAAGALAVGIATYAIYQACFKTNGQNA